MATVLKAFKWLYIYTIHGLENIQTKQISFSGLEKLEIYSYDTQSNNMDTGLASNVY